VLFGKLNLRSPRGSRASRKGSATRREAFSHAEGTLTGPHSLGPAGDQPNRFDVYVSRTAPTTAVISLVGDHDASSARSFQGIADAQLSYCNKVIVDFTSATIVDDDVLAALVEFAGHARTQSVALQIVSQEGTYIHDVLELFGILDRLDSTDRLPRPE
jgi:anti-anti-sigma regulatory factor